MNVQNEDISNLDKDFDRIFNEYQNDRIIKNNEVTKLNLMRAKEIGISIGKAMQKLKDQRLVKQY